MKPMSLGDIFRPLGHVCARDAPCDTLISARHPRLSSRQSGRARKAQLLGRTEGAAVAGRVVICGARVALVLANTLLLPVVASGAADARVVVQSAHLDVHQHGCTERVDRAIASRATVSLRECRIAEQRTGHRGC